MVIKDFLKHTDSRGGRPVLRVTCFGKAIPTKEFMVIQVNRIYQIFMGSLQTFSTANAQPAMSRRPVDLRKRTTAIKTCFGPAAGPAN